MASRQHRCPYCAKRFQRLEHLQRHRRIHTQEKPFACSCGQAYTRKDLLVRHERLTRHASEGISERDDVHAEEAHMKALMGSFPLKPVILPTSHDSEMEGGESFQLQDQHVVDDQLETTVNVLNGTQPDAMENWMTFLPDLNSASAGMMTTNCADDQLLLYEPGEATSEAIPTLLNSGGASFDILDSYWDTFDMSSAFILPVFDNEYSMPCWPPKGENHRQTENYEETLANSSTQNVVQSSENNTISLTRFESRMPSPQPSPACSTQHCSNVSDVSQLALTRISLQEYGALQARMKEFESVLPDDFSLCSRRMLSRFYEGYVNGYDRNIPLLHLSTMSITGTALELLLAMAGVGAYYRFEPERGDGLLRAAKAISFEKIQRRQGLVGRIEAGGLTSRSMSPASDPDTSLQTLNALFLVMSMWIWRPRALLNEALSLQSLIANLVRETSSNVAVETNLTPSEAPAPRQWKAWVKAESNKRTRLIIFSAFNLHCVAYNIPPLLLTAEVRCSMPSFDDEWRARSAEEWSGVSRRHRNYQKGLHERLDQLNQRDHQPSTEPVSSLGAYVLIAALVQRIFFLRQSTGSSQLKIDDIDELGRALRGWQTTWEASPESSLSPQSSFGSVAFNSTALLRVAWIRLHCDLGPCRSLKSQDPVLVAQTLKSSPPLERGPRLTRAVLQAAHALLIPMRMGSKYAARLHTPSWSMLHALCNLECAILLTKWLESVALTITKYALNADEANLLRIVRSIIDETDFADSSDTNLTSESAGSNNDIGRLGVQVANVWADIFKTAHAFDLVTVIGDSLEKYAQLLEQSIEGM